MAATLFVIATPIGNLGDMSPRAVETLKGVAVILAEDTRHSRPMLERFGIATPMESYREHNEARMTERIVERLLAGEDVALISDAGTPLLSDPGERLVRAAAEHGIRIVPVPGASALLAALVASGIAVDRFTFFGFLERKGRDRTEALTELAELQHTGVIYEAPARVAGTLRELEARGGGQRIVAVARELTKQFEEIRRGTVAELARYYEESPPRGEVVIVLEGRMPVMADEELLRTLAHQMRSGGMTTRDIVRALVRDEGAPRNLAYRIAHE
jgi:16S rRNA (cytidine1402-2'-O)-methyltransferase